MFTIISIMFIGIGIGYLMRNVQMLQKVEKSASLTILLLLFVLGVSIGSNRLIVDNLGRFGWQAAVLASLSITGSMLASLMAVSYTHLGHYTGIEYNKVFCHKASLLTPPP